MLIRLGADWHLDRLENIMTLEQLGIGWLVAMLVVVGLMILPVRSKKNGKRTTIAKNLIRGSRDKWQAASVIVWPIAFAPFFLLVILYVFARYYRFT